MAFSFVHAADLHLDCPFEGLGDVPAEFATLLRESTFRALDRIVDICIEQKAAFLVVAGDVYNAKDKSLPAQLKFRDALSRLADANIPSFAAFGNHDPKSGWSAELDWPDHAHLFSSGKPETFPVLCRDTEVATVSGVSYAKQAVMENLATRFSRPADSPFAVGVLHCNCGQVSQHEPYSPCTLDDLVRSSFDYWALGHVHKGGVLRGHGPAVAYPGNPQGLNPKETGAKGCYVVHVSDGGALDIQFAETDAVRWFSRNVDAAHMVREQELLSRISEVVDETRTEAGRPALLRLSITGRSALHRSLARPNVLTGITDELRDADCPAEETVWVESIRNETKPDVDLDARRKSEDFLGDFLRAIELMRQNPDKLAELEEVLEPLFADKRAHRYLPDPDQGQLLAWLDEAETYGLDALLGGEEE
jgi:exonuclease SbcD